MDTFLLLKISFYGLFFTGFLLLTAILTKITCGLFWSRTPKEFIEDQHEPYYEQERKIGSSYSDFVLKYLTPFFLAFLIIFIWFNR